jgi:hypothetical protein
MSSRNLVVCSPHCRLRILLQVAAALAMVQVQHVRSFASCMPFFSRSMLLFLHHTATSIRTHSATEPSSYTPHRLMHPSHSYAPLPLFGSRWPSSRSHTHTHTHTHTLCMCITRLSASMVRYRCPSGCVPPPTLSTPHVEQATAARGRSPTLCQPLRSHIGSLASQGIARAPLATRI